MLKALKEIFFPDKGPCYGIKDLEHNYAKYNEHLENAYNTLHKVIAENIYSFPISHADDDRDCIHPASKMGKVKHIYSANMNEWVDDFILKIKKFSPAGKLIMETVSSRNFRGKLSSRNPIANAAYDKESCAYFGGELNKILRFFATDHRSPVMWHKSIEGCDGGESVARFYASGLVSVRGYISSIDKTLGEVIEMLEDLERKGELKLPTEQKKPNT